MTTHDCIGTVLAILTAVPALAQQPIPTAAKRSYVPASVRAMPGLECRIYPEGAAASAGLTVFTDNDGFARFHAVRATAAGKAQRLNLDCKDSAGRSAFFSTDLTSDDTFQPRPLNLAHERGIDRPALAGDPQSYTQAELIQAGYGLRPDAEKSPAAYARWLDAARRPGRMLLAKRPSPYSHTVTKETGAPWVGSVLTGAPNYLSVEANFNVPTAVPDGDETTAGTAIAIWDGLGGFSGPSGGLIQAGVDVQTAGIVALYDSWREYCCGDGDSNGYGGAFTPNPGDAIYDQNWYCDASGNVNLNGGYGCSFLQDITTGAIFSCTSSTGTPCWSVKAVAGWVLGSSAEFVVENQTPQVSPGATQFTDFTPEVSMTGSAENSITLAYSQTISNDPTVYELTDFTNTTSHMNVSLGNPATTNFSMSQWESASGVTANDHLVTCGNNAGKLCYSQAIAVGPNGNGSSIGDGWIISNTGSGEDYVVYRWKNSGWVKQTGIVGVMIAVSPTGNAWVVDHAGKIHYNNGSAWELAPGNGCATAIAVGPNAYGSKYGDPWMIGCGGAAGVNGNVFQLQGSTWKDLGGAAVQIAIGNLGLPWVVNATGGISFYNGSGFTSQPGCATSIAVGPLSAGIPFGDSLGDVWTTGCTPGNTGYGIYQLQFGAWTLIQGAATQIAVSPDLGVPWTVNNKGQVYR